MRATTETDEATLFSKRETILPRTARISVRCLPELCVIQLRDARGMIKRVAAANRPSRVVPGTLLQSKVYYDSAKCWADLRKPTLLRSVAPDWIAEFAGNDPDACHIRALEVQSAVTAPLTVNPEFLGAITFFTFDKGRPYGPEELSTGSDLAQQCIAAIGSGVHRGLRGKQSISADFDRTEFLARVTHELRTPLMPLLGWARIFRNHPLVTRDEMLREGAGALERSARNLLNLVDSSLDLARISRGKAPIRCEQINLNTALQASIETIRESAWRKQQSLLVEISSTPLSIAGDEMRLQQVIINLLVNAINYTPQGGRIYVRSYRAEQEAGIEVSDNGIGIDPEQLEQIFEPFKQGCNEWAGGAGLGLGLAIARQIVELHAGRIWAESRGLGTGSSFHCRFPFVESDPEKDQSTSRAKLRILVVDDSIDILNLLRLQIESMGHSIYSANNTKKALELMGSHPVDLIISDIGMPGEDGLLLIRMIRAAPCTHDIPALALTGYNSQEAIGRALDAGFDACISKPVESDELEKWIRRLTNTPEGSTQLREKY